MTPQKPPTPQPYTVVNPSVKDTTCVNSSWPKREWPYQNHLCSQTITLCRSFGSTIGSNRNALEDGRFPNLEVFAWTESTVILAWKKIIRVLGKLSSPTAWQKSKEQYQQKKWNHVITDSSPPDWASSGMSLQKLKDHQLWWLGPAWLRMSSPAWSRNYIVLPKESLTKSKRSHQADENYRQTIVSNETYKAKQRTTYSCLPASL